LIGSVGELSSPENVGIISQRHPELRDMLEDLKGALEDPEMIKRSVYNENVLLFYRYYAHIYEGKHMCVMEKKLKFFFDKKGDVLDIAIGKPKEAISREIGNDVIIRIDPKTKEIVGFTILNFEKRFEHRARSETLPITATFGQIEVLEG